MEEKKRRGYKSQEQQTEATKKYRNTEKGSKNTLRSNYKSNCKKFIKDYANNIELDELQVLIKEKREELKMLENLLKNLKKEFIGSYDEVALAIAHAINFYLRDNNIKFKDLEVEDDFIRLTINKSNIYIFDLEKEEKIENICYYTVVDIYKQQIN